MNEKGGKEDKKPLLVSLFCRGCGSYCGSQYVEQNTSHVQNVVSWCGKCNEMKGMN